MDCLLKHLLAANDVDALLHLAHALTSEVEDGTVSVKVSVKVANASSIVTTEEECLNVV